MPKKKITDTELYEQFLKNKEKFKKPFKTIKCKHCLICPSIYNYVLEEDEDAGRVEINLCQTCLSWALTTIFQDNSQVTRDLAEYLEFLEFKNNYYATSK